MNDPEFRIGDDGEIENLRSLGKRKQKPKEGMWQRSVPIPLPLVLFVGGAAGLLIITLIWIFILFINRDRPAFDYDELRPEIAQTSTAIAEPSRDQRDDLSVGMPVNLDVNASVGNEFIACQVTPITNDQRIVFSAGRTGESRNLYLSDINGRNICQLTGDNLTHENYPAWSPDGSQIVLSAVRSDKYEIYVVNLVNWTFHKLTEPRDQDTVPVWSPDGTQVAYFSYQDGVGEIFLIDEDGSDQRSITNLQTTYRRARWSPDGTDIVFDAFVDNTREIFITSADGLNLRRLTDDSFDDGSPAWSPDNSRIVFTSQRAGSTHLYIMNTDGTNAQQLPFESTFVFDPLWISTDRIAFGAVRDGNREVWTMNADSTNPTQVMLPLSVTTFDWLP